MKKNLLRYFSLFLISFSITTFGQINLGGKAYAAVNGSDLINQNFGDKDIYSFKITIGTIDIDFNISGKETSGWIKNGDKWYYIDPETKELKHGWFKDKEDWYYFNDDGTLYTGWLAQDGSRYYFKQTGNMAKGWFKDNGSWYYCDSDGKMKTGWFKDHGNWYYFNENGKMQTSDLFIDGVLFKFNNHGELQLD